jgi:hypothetical protein
VTVPLYEPGPGNAGVNTAMVVADDIDVAVDVTSDERAARTPPITTVTEDRAVSGTWTPQPWAVTLMTLPPVHRPSMGAATALGSEYSMLNAKDNVPELTTPSFVPYSPSAAGRATTIRWFPLFWDETSAAALPPIVMEQFEAFELPDKDTFQILKNT